MRINAGIPPVNPYSAKYQSIRPSGGTAIPASGLTPAADGGFSAPAVTLSLSEPAMNLLKTAMQAPESILKLLR